MIESGHLIQEVPNGTALCMVVRDKVGHLTPLIEHLYSGAGTAERTNVTAPLTAPISLTASNVGLQILVPTTVNDDLATPINIATTVAFGQITVINMSTVQQSLIVSSTVPIVAPAGQSDPATVVVSPMSILVYNVAFSSTVGLITPACLDLTTAPPNPAPIDVVATVGADENGNFNGILTLRIDLPVGMVGGDILAISFPPGSPIAGAFPDTYTLNSEDIANGYVTVVGDHTILSALPSGVLTVNGIAQTAITADATASPVVWFSFSLTIA